MMYFPYEIPYYTPPYPHVYPNILHPPNLLQRFFFGFGSRPDFFTVIENAQKVINIVQNVTPMIQQYGPIIRNLPAIYQMLKKAPTSPQQEKQPASLQVKKTKPQVPPTTFGNLPAPKMYI